VEEERMNETEIPRAQSALPDHRKDAMAYPKTKRDRRDEFTDEEEKVLAGRSDANMPALLTKDVPGG
jgi:hypothetical protein